MEGSRHEGDEEGTRPKSVQRTVNVLQNHLAVKTSIKEHGVATICGSALFPRSPRTSFFFASFSPMIVKNTGEEKNRDKDLGKAVNSTHE